MSIETAGVIIGVETGPDGTWIRLEGDNVLSKEGWYKLDKGHLNYNGIHSLALLCLGNRYNIVVRTYEAQSQDKYAEVKLLRMIAR